MNTYQVTYFPPNGGTSAPVVVTVLAADFVADGDAVVFFDTAHAAVLWIPLELTPVISRTATA